MLPHVSFCAQPSPVYSWWLSYQSHSDPVVRAVCSPADRGSLFYETERLRSGTLCPIKQHKCTWRCSLSCVIQSTKCTGVLFLDRPNLYRRNLTFSQPTSRNEIGKKSRIQGCWSRQPCQPLYVATWCKRIITDLIWRIIMCECHLLDKIVATPS